MVLLTYNFGLFVFSVMRVPILQLPDLKKKQQTTNHTTQQIKFVDLFICFSFTGTDPTDRLS